MNRQRSKREMAWFAVRAILLLLVLKGDSCGGGSTSYYSSPGYSSTGKGGSMSRFTVIGKKLYTVGDQSLSAFDVSTANNPTLLKTIPMRGGVETISPFGNKLFIGEQNGMSIYSVEESGDITFVSDFFHIRSRDPVVSDGKYAYVTLRDAFTLDILDVSNLPNIRLAAQVTQDDPQGLGLDSGVLFVANGSHGLYQYNRDSLVYSYGAKVISRRDAYDVIANKGLLISTGAEGITQFDYHDLSKVKELSLIPIKQ